MGSLIETFHIDIKLLLAQIVNFAVVVGVLYFFVFKPLLRMMADRERKIKDGLRFAEQAEEDLRNARQKGESTILEARQRADAEMEQAKRLAEEKKKDILQNATAEAEMFLAASKKMGEDERQRIVAQSKGDILDLAFAAAAVALGKNMKDADDEKFTKRMIKEL